jgi:hypothetical protein
MVVHAPPSMVGVYVRYKYRKERKGFEAWHRHLRGILRQEPGGNVVALHG